MEAFAGSEDLHRVPFVPVEGQCNAQIIISSPPVINEYKEANSHELPLSVYDPNIVPVDIVNLISDELVEVPVSVAELHPTHSSDSNIQDIQSNNRAIAQSRSWEDGYNWRKYGQKQIKGNEFPRSYYRCSRPNCQVKKQVEQSHDGRITNVIYRGKHDHTKPQSISHMASGTVSSVQQENINGVSLPESTEGNSSNGNGQTSHHAMLYCSNKTFKSNGIRELSVIVASDNNVGKVVQSSRIREEVQYIDGAPESTRMCLNFSTDVTSDLGANHGHCKESSEVHQSLAFVSSSSNESVSATNALHEMTPSATALSQPIDMAVTSKALVPLGVDSSNIQRICGADLDVQAIQNDRKRSCPLVTVDRFWGDGYNWRKYGQKQIKGSEFPRSYYRCTHPSCQVKKQLECSHDGQITDIVYKGEHNHPKPQPSSHVAVGRILLLQEEGFERFSSSNHINGKLLTTRHTELNGNSKLYPVQASNTVGQGEGSKPNRVDDKVEHSADLKAVEEVHRDAASGSNNQQIKQSLEALGQCQSPTVVLSPSVKNKDTVVSPHDLTPITVSNPPVYMVTSRGIVPVEVERENKRQKQVPGHVVKEEESKQNGLSLSMTERLLENAYHWRKYGQKSIKGSEFPRSYYRCTHPNCQVKMQLERSHDGRLIEIINKGRHDHPKPQPITRMAIGAILSLEEDKSGGTSDSSDKSSIVHLQAPVFTNPNRITEQSPGTQSVKNVETAGESLNCGVSEVEDVNDTESKRRKKDIGDVDLVPVIRTPRVPRVVVETQSAVDVVDDGYRWQKYGRKLVKGNSNPRNYYRCSYGGCSVKKHVERAANNPEAVVTTYEGKHNHDLPTARITTSDMAGIVTNTNGSNNMSRQEFVLNFIDTVAENSSLPESRMHEREYTIDMEPQSVITDLDSSKAIAIASVAANNCSK